MSISVYEGYLSTSPSSPHASQRPPQPCPTHPPRPRLLSCPLFRYHQRALWVPHSPYVSLAGSQSYPYSPCLLIQIRPSVSPARKSAHRRPVAGRPPVRRTRRCPKRARALSAEVTNLFIPALAQASATSNNKIMLSFLVGLAISASNHLLKLFCSNSSLGATL